MFSLSHVSFVFVEYELLEGQADTVTASSRRSHTGWELHIELARFPKTAL